MFDNESTVYVSSLPDDYSDEQANEFFGTAGKIAKLLLRNYKSSKGKYAFITYEDTDGAFKAFDTLNYAKIGKCKIFIQFVAKKVLLIRAKGMNAIIIRDVPEDETDETLYKKYKEFGQIVFLHLQKRNPRVCYIQYLSQLSVEKSNGEVYTYKSLANSYTKVKISGIKENDLPTVELLIGELGEHEITSKERDTIFVDFREHESAKSCINFLQNCVVGSSVLKIEMNEKRNNEFRFYFNALITHMGDEAEYKTIALKNLPDTVQCGQDVREICEKYGKVCAPRLAIDENRKSLGSAICTMMTHEDAVKAIEGINKENSGIVASRSITAEESMIMKEEMSESLSVLQRNSTKDRQFLIHGCESDEKLSDIKKTYFRAARSITKCGSLVLVIFKDSGLLDAAVSKYSGNYGNLFLFVKDENISAVPIDKSFDLQSLFPFRNKIIERLKLKIANMGKTIAPEKFGDVTPEVARFLIAHEKVLNAWIDE